jgi:hypothetical protein
VATNVRVRFDPPLPKGSNEALVDSWQVGSLPPNSSRILHIAPVMFNDTTFEGMPATHVTVAAHGPDGPINELSYELDLTWLQRAVLERDPLRDIANLLERHWR